jgi:ankyrin repeat protein
MRQGGLYLYYIIYIISILYISISVLLHVKVAMQVLEPFVVDKELDINYKAFMDETPLHVCAIYGSPKVCSWLLGVEDKKGRRLANPAAKDKDGWAPIHYAARFGHNDVLEMLPLHVAARFEQIDIITSLLDSGAAKEVKAGIDAAKDDLEQCISLDPTDKGVPAPRSSAGREPGDGDGFARTRLCGGWPSFECR